MKFIQIDYFGKLLNSIEKKNTIEMLFIIDTLILMRYYRIVEEK
jgi:hypothetical protein